MSPTQPYADHTTGEWVGEHETREWGGEIRRRTEWFDTEAEARSFSRTGHTDAERTRDHIRFKVSCRELDPVVAEQMLRLSEQDPGLDYRVLFQSAIRRDLSDTVFHVSPRSNRGSILAVGLDIRDPRLGRYVRFVPPSQQAAVYVSDLDEALAGRYAHGDASRNDIWQIDGLASLAPLWEQDQLNPTCWAVLAPIPPRLLTLHHAAIRQIAENGES
ncbi:hypothetical protein [Streptomyces sp. NPDC052042]|uniref:hypothetical protein n=1 Tax=Streptomyces sp. NPDC052042 TaxID=3365683 RepID=UPI0037D059BC